MNAADVLDKAADVIVERGWCQGGREDAEHRVCVRGALMLVTDGSPYGEGSDEFYAADTALSLHLNALTFVWNDREHRTADEVITALRECAASLRAAS